MENNECLICKKHYTQSGKCMENKRNCLIFLEEPRGKMVRTTFTFCIDGEFDTPVIKYNSRILIKENAIVRELVVIKINWLNLETRQCNITAEYHENEKPRFEKVKLFKVVN